MVAETQVAPQNEAPAASDSHRECSILGTVCRQSFVKAHPQNGISTVNHTEARQPADRTETGKRSFRRKRHGTAAKTESSGTAIRIITKHSSHAIAKREWCAIVQQVVPREPADIPHPRLLKRAH